MDAEIMQKQHRGRVMRKPIIPEWRVCEAVTLKYLMQAFCPMASFTADHSKPPAHQPGMLCVLSKNMQKQRLRHAMAMCISSEWLVGEAVALHQYRFLAPADARVYKNAQVIKQIQAAKQAAQHTSRLAKQVKHMQQVQVHH